LGHLGLGPGIGESDYNRWWRRGMDWGGLKERGGEVSKGPTKGGGEHIGAGRNLGGCTNFWGEERLGKQILGSPIW